MFDIYDPKWHLKCHRSFPPPPWIPVVVLACTGTYLQVPVAVLILNFCACGHGGQYLQAPVAMLILNFCDCGHGGRYLQVPVPLRIDHAAQI